MQERFENNQGVEQKPVQPSGLTFFGFKPSEIKSHGDHNHAMKICLDHVHFFTEYSDEILEEQMDMLSFLLLMAAGNEEQFEKENQQELSQSQEDSSTYEDDEEESDSVENSDTSKTSSTSEESKEESTSEEDLDLESLFRP